MKFNPHFMLIGMSLLLLACGNSSTDGRDKEAISSTPFRPGASVEFHLESNQANGLPELSDLQVEQTQDLLDASSIGGRLGIKALAKLAEMPAKERASALLKLVENRETETPIRQLAYAQLRDHGDPAMLPRLTLQLKYEKDSWSAVCIADTLLLHSNGAGLTALMAILGQEQVAAEHQSARTYAAISLANLPATKEWKPGTGFEADWKRLLSASQLWDSRRRLIEDEASAIEYSADMTAELWRMIARFRSQPLRPVDDARFVLLRQRGTVIPLLLQAALDPNRYVREHALQTLGWMGTPIGHWAQEHDFDYVTAMLPSLNDPLTRTRALEAIGAAGIPKAAAAIWQWIELGNREETSAACDALLRCADASMLPSIQRLLSQERASSLSPEAAYSLYTLQFELDPNLESEYPSDLLERLAETEQQRRDNWLRARQKNVNSVN